MGAVEAPVAILDEPRARDPAAANGALGGSKRRALPQVTPTLTTREAEGSIDVKRDTSKSSSVCEIQ